MGSAAHANPNIPSYPLPKAKLGAPLANPPVALPVELRCYLISLGTNLQFVVLMTFGAQNFSGRYRYSGLAYPGYRLEGQEF